jgi:hypothetical protein
MQASLFTPCLPLLCCLHLCRLAFTAPSSFAKPEFARKPLIRDSFFRKTNVVFPPGCDATTAQ